MKLWSKNVCVSDGGAVWAEGECAGRSAESTSSQHGWQPECPFSATLLYYTESSGLQGVCGGVLVIVSVIIHKGMNKYTHSLQTKQPFCVQGGVGECVCVCINCNSACQEQYGKNILLLEDYTQYTGSDHFIRSSISYPVVCTSQQKSKSIRSGDIIPIFCCPVWVSLCPQVGRSGTWCVGLL